MANAGPWEDYEEAAPPSANAQEDGPWNDFEDPATASAPADPRTGLQKVANILWAGAYPKPEAPDTRSDAEKAAEFEQYKANLPAGLAAGASMLLPIPGTALGRIAMAAGSGGAVGALQPAKEMSQRLDNATSGFGLGAVTGVGGEMLLGAGNALVNGSKWVGGKLAAAAGKIGEAWSGVPEQEIQTYATQADQIKNMMKKAGGELPQATDEARQRLQDQIRAKRQALSSKVGSSLEAAGPAQTLDIQPVIDRLGEVHSTIDPNLHPEAAAEIEDLADRISSIAGPDGKVSPGQMHDIKEMLQESAKPSYLKNGQMFQPGKLAQQAAKGGAAVARKSVNAAVPDVAAANNQLTYLHTIEDSLNKNLLAPGKPDAAFLAAGSGTNPRNALMLKRLDSVAGTDALGDAQRLAAAKTFSNPSLNPLSATGKTLMHVLRGGTIGGAVGAAGAEVAGFDPVDGAKYGAAIGGGLASPFALKMGINAGRIPVQLAGKLAPQALQALGQYPGAVGALVNGELGRNQPQSTPGVPGTPSPLAQTQANRSPSEGPQAYGPAAWAASGLKNLGLDQQTASRVMQDPKGVELVHQASNYPPGSKALKQIMTQIQSKWGKSQ